MDNLRTAIRATFVDQDFDKVLKSRHSMGKSLDYGMDGDDFAETFMKNSRMFGSDEVKKIDKMYRNAWLKLNPSDKPSVFNLLTAATDKMLTWQNEAPVCKYTFYLRWNELSSLIGDDLLTTSFIARNDWKNHIDRKFFGWKPITATDSIDVKNVVGHGLHEIHSHMKASSINSYINWLAVVNMSKHSFDKLPDDLACQVIKAAAIRYYLFLYLKNPKSCNSVYQKLQYLLDSSSLLEIKANSLCFKEYIETSRHCDGLHFGNDAVDYAIPQAITVNDNESYFNVPLIGERMILYSCLKKIYAKSDDNETISLLLYAYLLAKNHYFKYVIQNNEIKGFSNFQKFEKRKDMNVKGSDVYEKLIPFMTFHNNIGNQSFASYETRITPSDKAKNISKSINKSNECINDEKLRLGCESVVKNNNVKIGYVLHFIKKADEDKHFERNIWNDGRCRNEELRDYIWESANAIAKLIRANDKVVCRRETGDVPIIVGIDAAGSEFGCRPEVFGPAFRYLATVKPNGEMQYFEKICYKSLGRTFHVGEAFYDIVDGLRAIDESILFLNLSNGDRIGHGIALGADVSAYYKTRHYTMVMPKQDLLDNIVWLLSKMDQYSIADRNGLRYRLEQSFLHYFNVIYDRHDVSYHEYYMSWMLRGDKPELVDANTDVLWIPTNKNSMPDNIAEIRNNKKICELYCAYHYDSRVKAEGNIAVEYKMHETDVEIISLIQKLLRVEIAKLHIAIETNPTSNIKITDLERYSDHPIVKFNNHGLVNDPLSNDNPRIDVSINTDDQGVFNTSLEKEFALMAIALEKEKDVNGEPIFNPDDVYRWLDEVRESAGKRSFANNN